MTASAQIRINPRALEAAVKGCLEGQASKGAGYWATLTASQRRECLREGERLLRLYRQAHLDDRSGGTHAD